MTVASYLYRDIDVRTHLCEIVMNACTRNHVCKYVFILHGQKIKFESSNYSIPASVHPTMCVYQLSVVNKCIVDQ